MTARTRDVIVVGAGPAGATAATALAQKGYDVLLLDRQAFPRDKTCGDAVPAGAIRIMHNLGMQPKVAAAVARQEFYPVHKLLIVSPRGVSIQADFLESDIHSYIAPRLYFDAVIQQHAVESGADFQVAQVTAPLVEDGCVVGVQARFNGSVKEVRGRVVIGADGATSVIARGLRPTEHPDLHSAVALRAYIDDMEELPHVVEFYLYKEILPGYAWIFPIGEGRANIGLGMRLDKFRRIKGNLKEMLQHFLQMPAIKQRLRHGGRLSGVKTWQLTFGSLQATPRVYPGALLIGDAGAFINPLTGGGIHNGLISAVVAADVIDQALQQGDVSQAALSPYQARCDAAMWEGMSRSYTIQRWLLRFPFLVDVLAWRMRENSELARIFLTKL